MSIRAGRLIGPSLFFSFVLLLLGSAQAQVAGQSASTRQVAIPSLIVQPVDETKLAVLKGNTHPLARMQYDQGSAPLDLPMNRMLLVLKRSDAQETSLRKLLDDQQDKSSPNYHKWLTPEDFGKQFGPSDQDIQTVTTWLQSHGFQIAQVAKGRNVIEFSGTAAQVQEALHTEIHKYVVNGEEHWANAKDPAIPAALRPVVNGVLTLHNFVKQTHVHSFKKPIQAKFRPGRQPETTFPSNPPEYALSPADFATIYNINPVYNQNITGSGQTIAVVGRSDLYSGGYDVSTFRSTFNLCCGYVQTIFNGPDPLDLGGDEELEATLDVSWSGGIAPDANIDFVVSATTNTTDGVDLSELYIIDNNLASVMTESFGSCEAAFNQTQADGVASLAEQAAAQGITYMVSTGDTGAEGCNSNAATMATGPVSANLLASTPYTIAVGGNMFNENGQNSKYWSSTNGAGYVSAVSYIPEDAWNESCTEGQCGNNANILAGSGGASIFFSKPIWQAGVQGIPNDGARDIPDLSFTAAGHDPYLLCIEGSCIPDQNGNFYLYFVYGTSAAAPSFAGVMSLVDQATNSSQGQADYVLYKLAANESLSQCNGSNTAGQPASNCIFNDVTSGNNAVPGEVNYGLSNAQYQAGTGYDLATGLGSVNVANLVNNWNTAAASKSTVTTLAITVPNNSIHGAPISFTVNVAPASGTGIPSGDVSLIATTSFGQQSLGFYTLTGGSISASTNLLPGGNYSIHAHYAGDGNFKSSDSIPSLVTVSSEPSVTTASVLNYQNATFTTAPYGTFAYVRADVHGNSGQGTPTGFVYFNDTLDGSIGGYVLNSQGNTATPNGYFDFTPGSHTLAADYFGDLSFNSSNSAGVPFTITQGSTTVAVSSAGNAQGATITATVNTAGSGGNPPSGTVSFTLNGQPLGTAIPVNGVNAVISLPADTVATAAYSTASYADPALVNGQYTVAATYTGDTNYTGSAGSSTINVKPDFALTESDNVIDISVPGSAMGLSVSISAEDGFNSAVTFSCSGLPSESKCNFSPASVTANGSTTLTITTTAAKTAMLEPQNHHQFGWLMLTAGSIFVGIFSLGGSKKRCRWTGLLSFMIFGLLLMLPACGGGSTSSGGGGSGGQSDPGTPTGSSIVTITATGGSVTHSTTFNLVVQ